MKNYGLNTVGELKQALQGVPEDIEIAWGVVDRLEGGEDIIYDGAVENSADPRRIFIILRERDYLSD